MSKSSVEVDRSKSKYSFFPRFFLGLRREGAEILGKATAVDPSSVRWPSAARSVILPLPFYKRAVVFSFGRVKAARSVENKRRAVRGRGMETVAVEERNEDKRDGRKGTKGRGGVEGARRTGMRKQEEQEERHK